MDGQLLREVEECIDLLATDYQRNSRFLIFLSQLYQFELAELTKPLPNQTPVAGHIVGLAEIAHSLPKPSLAHEQQLLLAKNAAYTQKQTFQRMP